MCKKEKKRQRIKIDMAILSYRFCPKVSAVKTCRIGNSEYVADQRYGPLADPDLPPPGVLINKFNNEF